MGLVMLGMFHPQNNRGVDQFLYLSLIHIQMCIRDRFGRIQLIRQKKGLDGREHFYRLDMAKVAVRNKVRGITSNEELDRIFDTDAERED